MRIINKENVIFTFLTTYKWVGYALSSVLDVQRFLYGMQDRLEYSKGMFLVRTFSGEQRNYHLEPSSDMRVYISKERAYGFSAAMMGWMTKPKKGEFKERLQAIFSGKVEWTVKEMKCTEQTLKDFLAGKKDEVPVTEWTLKDKILLGRGSLKPGVKNINAMANALLLHLSGEVEEDKEEEVEDNKEEAENDDGWSPMLGGVSAETAPEYDDKDILAYTHTLTFAGEEMKTKFTCTRTSKDTVLLKDFEFVCMGAKAVHNTHAHVLINTKAREVAVVCPPTSFQKESDEFTTHIRSLDTNELFDVVFLNNGDKPVRATFRTREEQLLYVVWPPTKVSKETSEKRIRNLLEKYGIVKSLQMHDACAYAQFADVRDAEDCYSALKDSTPPWSKTGTLAINWA